MDKITQISDYDREDLISVIVRTLDDLTPAYERDLCRPGKPAHGVRMAVERLFFIAEICGVHGDVVKGLSAKAARLY
ncbi:MAG: hypothetical protein E6R03_09975 [Hyphomicrobiaceae bacterium]|nr:MAG: hypothetical protein E6R03_09975 [Hyphomicrobiaceae bacterium]